MSKKLKLFKRDLTKIINIHNIEDCCSTPDFIIADFLVRQLKIFCKTTGERDAWYRGDCDDTYGDA